MTLAYRTGCFFAILGMLGLVVFFAANQYQMANYLLFCPSVLLVLGGLGLMARFRPPKPPPPPRSGCSRIFRPRRIREEELEDLKQKEEELKRKLT